MSEQSAIAWTHHTFNPVWGCAKVSPGCKNCYAERKVEELLPGTWWGPGTSRKTMSPSTWLKPERWDRVARRDGVRQRVFCGSLCDIFEDHPTTAAELAKLWPLIRRTPSLDWLLLSKRAERIADCLPADWGEGYGNVWLGVTIESADYAGRADFLRVIPAAVRFVSYEPALGPLADALDLKGIDWVIYGGESGARFRPHDLAWARAMRDRCRAEGVAFFYKQEAAIRSESNPYLDGERVQEYPTPRRLEVPAPAGQGSLFGGAQ